MSVFDLMTQHFWIPAFITVCINGFILKVRSRSYIKASPELAEGYSTLLRGLLFWGNIPWIVMGFGSTVGDVRSVWDYFRPQDGNPYVIAWFVSVILLWILGTYWLYEKGGAEMLVKHPGLLNGQFTSPSEVKTTWLLCLLGGAVAAVAMCLVYMPVVPLS